LGCHNSDGGEGPFGSPAGKSAGAGGGSADTVKELQAAGCESLRAIAAELEARGIPAARGGKWSAVQVSRLLARVNPSTVQRISRPFDGAASPW